MRLHAIVPAVLMVLGSAMHHSDASSLMVSPSESERNEKAVLKYLWPALKSAGKAGRIYYQATCQPDEIFPVAFPHIDAQPPSEGQAGLAAIQEIFRNNKDAKVTKGPSGIVRIMIGKIPTAILRTRISVLTLDPLDQYNPQLAIVAVEQAKEVQASMRHLSVRVPPILFDMLVAQPAEGLFHLPTALTKVTMDQALDQVATTFQGIVLYAACSRPRLFDLDFTGGYNFDDRWLTTESGPQ